MKDRFVVICFAVLIILLMVSGAYFQWWRCGEMFPHAQLACFFGKHL